MERSTEPLVPWRRVKMQVCSSQAFVLSHTAHRAKKGGKLRLGCIRQTCRGAYHWYKYDIASANDVLSSHRCREKRGRRRTKSFGRHM